MTELLTKDMDGSTFLGFLAATGALRLLTQEDAGARLRFDRQTLCAAFLLPSSGDAERAVAIIMDGLARDRRALELGKSSIKKISDLSPDALRAIASSLATKPDAAWIAALAAEPRQDRRDEIDDTSFRTLDAGQTSFLGTLRSVLDETTPENVRQTLAERWAWSDLDASLRFTPADDRQYALRASDPSKTDKNRTQRGASALAICAFPLLPLVPSASGSRSVGFCRDGRTFEWGLSDAWMSVETVRAVLAAGRFSQDDVVWRARGIFRAYATRRMNVGRYRNFTPATGLW